MPKETVKIDRLSEFAEANTDLAAAPAEEREQIGIDDFVFLQRGKTSGALYWRGVRLCTADDLAEIKHQLDALRDLQKANVKCDPPPSLKP
jgi:hypothetical protein